MTTTPFADELDHEVAERRLLDHPFYKAWSAGTLVEADLAFYATQYWRQVEAFPRYLTVLAERIPPSNARHVVLSNLADELDDDHPSLWVRFAQALGHSRATLETAVVERETRRCIERFDDAVGSAPVPFALGMLYGYESQTPAVAAAKIEGLRAHYGIEGPAVSYFEVHAEVDVEHARQLGEAIEEIALRRTDLIDAKTGARAGADAVLGLLDGVARACGLEDRGAPVP